MDKKVGSVNYTRDNLFQIVNTVRESGVSYTVTRNGTHSVVMISAEAYDELKTLTHLVKKLRLTDESGEQKQSIIDTIYKSVKPKYHTNKTDKDIAKEAKDEHVLKSEEKLRKQWKNSI